MGYDAKRASWLYLFDLMIFWLFFFCLSFHGLFDDALNILIVLMTLNEQFYRRSAFC